MLLHLPRIVTISQIFPALLHNRRIWASEKFAAVHKALVRCCCFLTASSTNQQHPTTSSLPLPPHPPPPSPPLFSYETIRKQWLGGADGFDVAARGGGGGALVRSPGAGAGNQSSGARSGVRRKRTTSADAGKGEGAGGFKYSRPVPRDGLSQDEEPNKAEQQQQQVPFSTLDFETLNLYYIK